jgi:hypothetical protein
VKSAIPLVEQMQQTARCAQTLSALRAAVFMRGDSPQKPMQRGERFLFTPQLQPRLNRRDLGAEKGQEPPQRGPMQGPFVNPRLAWWRHVAQHSAVGRDHLLQRPRVVLQVLAGQRQEARAGIPPVREYESRANR